MKTCRDCSAEIETGLLCPKCKSLANLRNKEKKRIRERNRKREAAALKGTKSNAGRHLVDFEPNTACPYWGKKSCSILTPAICREKECGFYPPVAEKRKAAIREGLRG
jgi:hypothetical protein